MIFFYKIKRQEFSVITFNNAKPLMFAGAYLRYCSKGAQNLFTRFFGKFSPISTHNFLDFLNQNIKKTPPLAK